MRSDPTDNPSRQPGLQAEQAAILAELAKAVLHNGQNLMIWETTAPQAASAGAALLAWWQALAPHVRISHFSGQHAEQWLGHINQDLAQRQLQAAAQAHPARLAADEICFLHDAEHLKADHLQLLQQLSRHIPGGSMRWVLLFKQAAHQPAWRPPAITPWLEHPQHWLNWDMNMPPATTSAPAAPIAAAGPSPAKRSQPVKIWLAGFLCLAALAGWVLHIQPPVRQEAPPAQPPAVPAAAATPRQADSAPSEAAKPPNLAERQVQNSPPAWNEVATPIAAPQSSLPEPIERPLSEGVNRGHRWLKGLSPEHFLLEHGSFDNELQAQTLMRSQPELVNARVIMVKTQDPQKPQYLVVTGPFRTEDRAQNFKARQNLPSPIRIRTVAGVVQQLQSSRP